MEILTILGYALVVAVVLLIVIIIRKNRKRKPLELKDTTLLEQLTGSEVKAEEIKVEIQKEETTIPVMGQEEAPAPTISLEEDATLEQPTFEPVQVEPFTPEVKSEEEMGFVPIDEEFVPNPVEISPMPEADSAPEIFESEEK